MDIWVRNTSDNYQKLKMAFREFGMPVFDMTEEKFIDSSLIDVFSFGRSPVVIEIMTALKGCDFDDAYNLSQIHCENGLDIRVIHLNTLRKAKLSAGRFKDLDDLEKLGE